MNREISSILLLSKNDIPFLSARVNIHQPTIREISFISEESFFSSLQFLLFDLRTLSEEDQEALKGRSDFSVFLSLLRNPEMKEYKEGVALTLQLLFPDYEIEIKREIIELKKDNFRHSINELNYDEFKDILIKMFCLDQTEQVGEYNPATPLAAKIAKKLEERKRILDAKKNSNAKDKVAVLNRLVSVLSIGLSMDMNILMDYSYYQLKDSYTRFILKEEYDLYLKAKLAGAEKMDEADNWIKDIQL